MEYCPWCKTYRIAVKHEYIRDLERTIEYRCEWCHKTIRVVAYWKGKSMTNIFREAKQLLDKKDAGGELTEEEIQLINTAELPLIMRGCPSPEEMAVRDCLEVLAKIVEEAANG